GRGRYRVARSIGRGVASPGEEPPASGQVAEELLPAAVAQQRNGDLAPLQGLRSGGAAAAGGEVQASPGRARRDADQGRGALRRAVRGAARVGGRRRTGNRSG